MPKFLEKKLKKEYGANSAVPYKVMNSIGAMQKKHDAKIDHEAHGYDFRHPGKGRKQLYIKVK